MQCPRHLLKILSSIVALLFCIAHAYAQSETIIPFAQADTSSPRSTLQTFLSALEQSLASDQKSFLSYMASDRLYPNASERRINDENNQNFLRGLETMDLSGLPSGFIRALAVEKIVLLIEVLSRVDIPTLNEIPTHEDMKSLDETSWRIPKTQIEIALVTEGARRGEYLFSARTIVRLEEFYYSLSDTPYKLAATQRYISAFRPYISTDSVYAIYSGAADGFGLLPVRWLFSIPSWLNTPVFGVALWKLLLLPMFTLAGILIVRFTWILSRKTVKTPAWRLFNTGLVTCILAWLVIPVCAQFHISGNVLYTLGFTSVIVLYLVGAWTAFIGANAVAETLIHFQSIREGSIDSQIVLLAARMVGLIIAIILLVEGADKLGLPSYSVVAGLSVGGLALAFAARETMANLLGSMVILMEKPFRSGHWIKVGDAEGVVEYIGFRSTRVRTSGDSVVSIPNGTLVNSVVDNLGLRGKRQQRFTLQIGYDTSPETVELFLKGVRAIVSNHLMTDKEVSHIYLNEFGDNGLEILLYFYLRVPDYSSELREREKILLQILKLAEELGVSFIAPHQVDESSDTNRALNPTTGSTVI